MLRTYTSSAASGPPFFSENRKPSVCFADISLNKGVTSRGRLFGIHKIKTAKVIFAVFFHFV